MAMFIGIDPDVSKSGVAKYLPKYERQSFFNSSEQYPALELFNLSFFDLLDFLKEKNNSTSIVVIEAGWLNRGNWHKTTGSNSINAQIGQRTGANHEVGKKIVEMCEYLGLKYELIKPTKSKPDAAYFKRVTGFVGRTNQEQRDAAMLVWGR
jgi:hypothetical protein